MVCHPESVRTPTNTTHCLLVCVMNAKRSTIKRAHRGWLQTRWIRPWYAVRGILWTALY